MKAEHPIQSIEGGYLHFNLVDAYSDFPLADAHDGAAWESSSACGSIKPSGAKAGPESDGSEAVIVPHDGPEPSSDIKICTRYLKGAGVARWPRITCASKRSTYASVSGADLMSSR